MTIKTHEHSNENGKNQINSTFCALPGPFLWTLYSQQNNIFLEKSRLDMIIFENLGAVFIVFYTSLNRDVANDLVVYYMKCNYPKTYCRWFDLPKDDMQSQYWFGMSTLKPKVISSSVLELFVLFCLVLICFYGGGMFKWVFSQSMQTYKR